MVGAVLPEFGPILLSRSASYHIIPHFHLHCHPSILPLLRYNSLHEIINRMKCQFLVGVAATCKSFGIFGILEYA